MAIRRKIRRPLLSSSQISEWAFGSEIGMWNFDRLTEKSTPDMRATFEQGAEYARGFYEDMITDGRLRVVKAKSQK